MRRYGPLAVVLLVQLGILGVVPARHIRARVTGVPVTLRTVPLDPYDIMAGYYVTLTYEVELEAARRLPTGAELKRGDVRWLVVRKAEPAWQLVAIERERPEPTPDTVALKARWRYGGVEIVGAGRLYVPEVQRKDADRVRTEALVDLKVGLDGTVAVLRLRAGDAVFGE